ncbi:oligosaccharyl transferase subunit ost3/OST6 [Coemansia sp. RSA 678]|nr:oligosaccharyl transferase subunit ost3/OST6 [Coemansia sp. RSA 678]
MRVWAVLTTALAAVCAGQSFSSLQQLGKADRDGVAQLELEQFMAHVVPETKDYAVVVQLTALSPQYKCDTCHAIDKSLRAVSRGWRRQRASRRIAFATLDVDNGEELFRKMGIDKIPRLMIFPAGRGDEAMANASPREMKLGAKNSHPAGMASRLSELFGTEIQADEPIDYMRYIIGVVGVLAAAFVARMAWRRVSSSVVGRNVWAVASITFVLVMTSGLMWNRINAPPFMGQTRTGDVVLFAPTNSQQYGVETQIVATAYAVCALCVVLLVRHVPRVPSGEQRALVAVMVVAALLLAHSYVNSVFRMKMPGYPFRLLLP